MAHGKSLSLQYGPTRTMELIHASRKFVGKGKKGRWVYTDPYVSAVRRERKAAQLAVRRAAQERARQNGKGRR